MNYTTDIKHEIEILNLIPGVQITVTDEKPDVILASVIVNGHPWEATLDTTSPTAAMSLGNAVQDVRCVQAGVSARFAPVHDAVAQGDLAKAIAGLARVMEGESLSKALQWSEGRGGQKV